MSAIKQALSGADGTGKVSAMRMNMFIVVFTIMGVFIAHNVIAMINGTAHVTFSWEEVTILMAAITGKIMQHRKEADVQNGGKSTLTTNGVYSSASSAAQSEAEEDADLAKG